MGAAWNKWICLTPRVFYGQNSRRRKPAYHWLFTEPSRTRFWCGGYSQPAAYVFAEKLPQNLCDRYHIEIEPDSRDMSFCRRFRRRGGFRILGGKSIPAGANMVLEEFRGCRLGRISLKTLTRGEKMKDPVAV
jgi:hypothetical protein